MTHFNSCITTTGVVSLVCPHPAARPPSAATTVLTAQRHGEISVPSTSYNSGKSGLGSRRTLCALLSQRQGHCKASVLARAEKATGFDREYEDELDAVANEEELYGDDDRPHLPIRPRADTLEDEGEDDEFSGIDDELSARSAGEGELETSLQEQLQGIYEEQRLDEQREREAASVDPADYLMNDWPEPPERTRLLAELLESAGVAVRGPVDLGDVQEIEVFGVQTDSRRVEVQDVFVCLEGEGLDGHDFALDAYRRGACAVIASRPLPEVPGECPVLLVDDTLAALHRIANAFYDWPSRAMTTVGVTGTNGKTTTSWLIRSVLEQMALVVGMVGTIEYALAEDRLDEEGSLWIPSEPDPTLNRKSSSPYRVAPYRGKYAVPNTTPGPLPMVKLLAGMRDRGAQAAVLEASSHGLSQGRLGGTDVDVAVFTGLSQDHLDFHGTMEEYKQAKLLLFRGLGEPAGALRERLGQLEERLEALEKGEGGGSEAERERERVEAAIAATEEQLADYLGRKRCVVNLDDPYVDEFRAAAGEVPVVTFGINDKDADVVAEKVQKTIWESEIRIRINLGEKQLRAQVVTALIGQHNVYNVLAAIATGLALGVPVDTIVQGIEAVEMVPGRMEIIDEGQGFPVVVDYAHTPEALARVLDAVRECGAKRVITVFGCGGDRDRTKRPLMGEVAHFKSDMVFFTNDNPRSEEPDAIISEIVAGLPAEIKDRHAGCAYPWLQDRIRVPAWYEDFLMNYQSEVKRYVVEDRFTAIRLAIGSAVDKDVVVIAGKGHEDYMEYSDGQGGLVRGWFDDRVEARNALSKLEFLDNLTKLGVIVRSAGPPWRDRYGD